MRLLPTALVLLGALYARAQPADQGNILACRQIQTGADATATLLKYGLPPPNDPNLFVAYYCEPFGGKVSCTEPIPEGTTCSTTYCVCCGEEEEIVVEIGYVGVDCKKVLNT